MSTSSSSQLPLPSRQLPNKVCSPKMTNGMTGRSHLRSARAFHQVPPAPLCPTSSAKRNNPSHFPMQLTKRIFFLWQNSPGRLPRLIPKRSTFVCSTFQPSTAKHCPSSNGLAPVQDADSWNGQLQSVIMRAPACIQMRQSRRRTPLKTHTATVRVTPRALGKVRTTARQCLSVMRKEHKMDMHPEEAEIWSSLKKLRDP